MVGYWKIVVVSVCALFLIPLVVHGGAVLSAQSQKKELKPIASKRSRLLCDRPGKDEAGCHAHIVLDDVGNPLAGATPSASSLGPDQFHTAYNLPCTPGGPVQSVCAAPATYGPQTIAIIDAYDDPTVEHDLAVYNTYFNLPPCTKASGCLTVIDQNGGTTLPAVNSNWALETSLDVQVAHALCQTCNIMLVEATTNSFANLTTAVNTAARLGATAISNSYGAPEWSTESQFDAAYSHPGIAVVASSGDSGYGSSYPAAAAGVVGVGGTTLQLFTDNTYASETVWNGAGSGCSGYEPVWPWQQAVPNWGQTGCGTKKGIADVAADADPSTGAAVYDSTPYNGSAGWWQIGGTSLSSPIIASVYALVGSVPANTQASSIVYKNFTAQTSHDVTSGSNGGCGTSMCNAASGYDGPTGLGTPNGLLGFTDTVVFSPTPTSVPPSPTIIVGDTQLPTVTLTNPKNGATVQRNSNLTISATATDNKGVARVEFSINGTLTCTDATAAYTCSWRVPNQKGVTYTITAKVVDTSANTASTSITVKSK